MNRFTNKIVVRFVRSCHHSRKLEEYQLKGVNNKFKKIGKQLVDINKELRDIGNMLCLDNLDITIDNKVCKKCFVDNLLIRKLLDSDNVIDETRESLNYICTICGNIRK